jgi:hypothetical protein
VQNCQRPGGAIKYIVTDHLCQAKCVRIGLLVFEKNFLVLKIKPLALDNLVRNFRLDCCGSHSS